MGVATVYDDDDAFDGCGVFQWRRRRTKARWRGQREMQQSKNRGNGGSGGNKRSFTDSHLKDLHAVFVQKYHLLRGEVHKKYARQIGG